MKASLTALLAVVLLSSMSMTGCVAQQHADQLAATNRTLKERVVELEQQIDELNERIAQLVGAGGDASALFAENERLKAELASMHVLPPELSNALKDWARENPGVATFEENTGTVKLAADVTFALGSAELSPAAQQAIAQLAGILSSVPAAGYEVRVVGHTDSVPIRRSATLQQHATNWHLSVHRAIAVRDALSKAGVPDVRTGVAGYSMYRPVVQNTSRGAEPNRRVEIYLVPMVGVDEALLGSQGGAGTPPAEAPTGNDAMYK